MVLDNENHKFTIRRTPPPKTHTLLGPNTVSKYNKSRKPLAMEESGESLQLRDEDLRL